MTESERLKQPARLPVYAISRNGHIQYDVDTGQLEIYETEAFALANAGDGTLVKPVNVNRAQHFSARHPPHARELRVTPMQKEHPLTVVFYVQDRDKFAALSDKFFESLRDQTEVDGAVVTAISMEDEITRGEELEQELER